MNFIRAILLFLILLAPNAYADDEAIKESDEATKIADTLNKSANDNVTLNNTHKKLLKHIAIHKNQKNKKLKKSGNKNIQNHYQFTQGPNNTVNAKVITTYQNKKTKKIKTKADNFQYDPQTQKTKLVNKNQNYQITNQNNLMSNQDFSNTLRTINRTKPTNNTVPTTDSNSVQTSPTDNSNIVTTSPNNPSTEISLSTQE